MFGKNAQGIAYVKNKQYLCIRFRKKGEPMREEELKALEEELKRRIGCRFDCSQETTDFIVNMVASFHSCRGGALYRIDDYCRAHGF